MPNNTLSIYVFNEENARPILSWKVHQNNLERRNGAISTFIFIYSLRYGER